jgi:hypothetical protein
VFGCHDKVSFVEYAFGFIWLGSNRLLVLMVLRCHIEYACSLCVFCLIKKALCSAVFS